jgi:very-short-patch-repair endonuclease
VYSLVRPELLTREARWLAAVFACGDGAALWRRTAAANLGVRPQSSGPIEIIVPSSNGRAKRPGIALRRSTSLVPQDVIQVEGIPTTTPRRTLADLRRILPPDHMRAVIERAERLRLDIGPQPGYEPDRTRNELERRMLSICRGRELPLPEVNVWIGPYEVDFLWPEQRLIVETDGWETHGTRSAFEADRERDRYLTALGYRVARYTHHQVFRDPSVPDSLEALLFSRAA